MPAAVPLIDPRAYSLERVQYDLERIRAINPQRYEFEQLTAVLHLDLPSNLIVCHRRVSADEFWVRGHVPGRPLFPGVMQLETLAQAAGFHSAISNEYPPGTFVAFAGVENVRFREQVAPPCDLWVAGKAVRSGKNVSVIVWNGQLLRGDGAVVAEGTVLGVRMLQGDKRLR